MNQYACGEVYLTITPKLRITYISNSMLQIINVDSSDSERVEALKNKPFFFLTKEDVPQFKECCHKAASDNSPVYFEHHLYDYNLRKIKMHGCVQKIKDSNEFQIICIPDNIIDKETRDYFFRSIEHIYDDAFEINTATAEVKVIRNQNYTDIKKGSYMSLWDFKRSLLKKLVHPEDRDKYAAFLDNLASHETPPWSTIEYRTQEGFNEVRWLQMAALHQHPNEILLCVSDITHIKNASQMQNRLKTDNISGLMNREAFEDLCCSYNLEKPFENTYNVLLLIEIDHFNDYSLDQQDNLLKKTGDLLRSYLRNMAIYARFGDNTFIVCFRDLKNKSDSKKKIDELFKHLRAQSERHSIPGYSMGFVRCPHGSEKGFRSAFECAKFALKDAIRSGGNTSRDYDLLSSHSHITRPPHEVKIQTFGYFEVFVDGSPVLFRNKKSKELLAVLVDHRGGYVTSSDVISCLWENEPVNTKTNARYRKAVMFLKRTLAEYGIDYIIETADRQRRLICDAVDCDLFRFLAGEEEYLSNYNGVYMLNYSWSEWTASYLNNIKNPLE